MLQYLSPAQAHLGGFVRVAPLSVLVLRAEAAGFYTWPIPISGSGYVGLPSYQPFTDAAISPPDGAANAGKAALGLRTLLSAALQAEVPLGGGFSLVAYQAAFEEYFRIGSAPFYYNVRDDVIARSDGEWIFSNFAFVQLGYALSPHATLRLGPEDETVYVHGSGYLGNLVGGIARVSFTEVGEMARTVEVFLRGGAYTHHAFRTGLSLGLGVSVAYDLLR